MNFNLPEGLLVGVSSNESKIVVSVAWNFHVNQIVFTGNGLSASQCKLKANHSQWHREKDRPGFGSKIYLLTISLQVKPFVSFYFRFVNIVMWSRRRCCCCCCSLLEYYINDALYIHDDVVIKSPPAKIRLPAYCESLECKLRLFAWKIKSMDRFANSTH